jgi:hypothetical protein
MKTPVLILVGTVFFGDLMGASEAVYAGLVFNLCGGVLYTYFRYIEAQQKEVDTAPQVSEGMRHSSVIV